MNEISDITTPKLKPVITYLYNCLFDPTKKFDALEGFDDVVDYGIVKFKGLESCRKIVVKYKDKSYELGLFNYIRDNGNTLGIRNGETDSNFIQYVFG
ncbi:hypothetical protein [Flavobacterium sp. WC2429]|uniref:Uncharacterized protein n=1 Tax=Flavobacterium sp. WC2429 TaxID=3234140 RepID=A0AB39WJ61_9FLAO